MNTYNIQFHQRAEEHQELILELLMKVIDPELGIDVVNLGLIYEVIFDDAGKLTVIMTLTTMGCPLIDYIVGDIRYAMSHVPGVEEIDVELTFEPHWEISKMSRFAKIALGIPASMG